MNICVLVLLVCAGVQLLHSKNFSLWRTYKVRRARKIHLLVYEQESEIIPYFTQSTRFTHLSDRLCISSAIANTTAAYGHLVDSAQCTTKRTNEPLALCSVVLPFYILPPLIENIPRETQDQVVLIYVAFIISADRVLFQSGVECRIGSICIRVIFPNIG